MAMSSALDWREVTETASMFNLAVTQISMAMHEGDFHDIGLF